MESLVIIAGIPYFMQVDDGCLEKVGSIYKPDMVSLFSCFAKGVVFDIGANVGCSSIALSRTASKVFAFEPNGSIFENLWINTGRLGNVHSFNYALGDKNIIRSRPWPCVGKSEDGLSIGGGRSLLKVPGNVTMRKLDSVMKYFMTYKGVDTIEFMNIDVDGMEPQVLKGASRTVKRFSPVVVMSFDHAKLRECSRYAAGDFIDDLRIRFPFLYALHGNTYVDLHRMDERYIALFSHTESNMYRRMIGAFFDHQLELFHAKFTRRLRTDW